MGTPHSEPLCWKAKTGNMFLEPETQLGWSELGVRQPVNFSSWRLPKHLSTLKSLWWWPVLPCGEEEERKEDRWVNSPGTSRSPQTLARKSLGPRGLPKMEVERLEEGVDGLGWWRELQSSGWT